MVIEKRLNLKLKLKTKQFLLMCNILDVTIEPKKTQVKIQAKNKRSYAETTRGKMFIKA